jgi:hypothetical protein
MKIKVTQKHIDEGVRGDPHKCPIALAIGKKDVLVNGMGIWFHDGRVKYSPSIKSIRKFMHDFDSRHKVKPTTFTVRFINGY